MRYGQRRAPRRNREAPYPARSARTQPVIAVQSGRQLGLPSPARRRSGCGGCGGGGGGGSRGTGRVVAERAVRAQRPNRLAPGDVGLPVGKLDREQPRQSESARERLGADTAVQGESERGGADGGCFTRRPGLSVMLGQGGAHVRLWGTDPVAGVGRSRLARAGTDANDASAQVGEPNLPRLNRGN